MDASQLWYPGINAFRLEHKYCIFYVPKVSEMPQNNSKHHFGSNGVEWVLPHFGIPK
jgi:hypothetical protein